VIIKKLPSIQKKGSFELEKRYVFDGMTLDF